MPESRTVLPFALIVASWFSAVGLSQGDSGPVVGPAHESLEELVPHARGVFLAVPEAVVNYGGGNSDLGMSRMLRLRVVSHTGFVPDGINWVLGVGNVKDPASVRRFFDPPEKRLKISASDFVIGRPYWFATADPAERRYYPQGIMNYWAADSSDVPVALQQAVDTDAYRWQPELRFPELGLTMGWHYDPKDSVLRMRVWKDRTLLWEAGERGIPGDVAFHRAYAYGSVDVGSTRPPSAEADSVILGKIRVRATLAPDNEYGVRSGVWDVTTVYRGYTGRRMGTAIFGDGHGGDDWERFYRAYDPVSGRPIYERYQDFVGRGLQPAGLPEGTFRRKVERWLDSSGKIDREVVSVGGDQWQVVEHDLGLAAGPVGVSSR